MPAAKSSPTPVTPDATAPDVHSPVAPEPPEHKDMYSTPPAQDDQVCIILKIVIYNLFVQVHCCIHSRQSLFWFLLYAG